MRGQAVPLAFKSPGRRISLMRLRANTIAMASSSDPEAVTKIRGPLAAVTTLASIARYGCGFAGTIKLYDAALPAGHPHVLPRRLPTRSALAGSGAIGNRFELMLDARCRTAEQAAQTRRELEAATTMLNRMIAREKHIPMPAT